MKQNISNIATQYNILLRISWKKMSIETASTQVQPCYSTRSFMVRHDCTRHCVSVPVSSKTMPCFNNWDRMASAPEKSLRARQSLRF